MNLTIEYIKYQFSQMSKLDIIKVVDKNINDNPGIIDECLDLSLAENADEIEFEKLMATFIDVVSIEINLILNVVVDVARLTDHLNVKKLLKGLHWLMYEREIIGYSDKYGSLYWKIDELISELIPMGYGKIEDVKRICLEWVETAV